MRNNKLKPQRGNNEKYHFDSSTGVVPPQALELEEVVLGAAMIEQNAIEDVIDFLKAESFYAERHKIIWNAIRLLYHSHQPIDLLTVTQQLKKTGELEIAGGPYYLAQLTNSIGSAANVEEHSRIIYEKAIRRRLISMGHKVVCKASDESTDVFNTLEEVGSEIDEISSVLRGESTPNFADQVFTTTTIINSALESGRTLTGIPTYSQLLDQVLMGFQPGDLIIIAARPGMGKTSIAVHIAKNQAKNGVPVGFFSLEMNTNQIIQKIISSESKIDLMKIKNAKLTGDEIPILNSVSEDITQFPLYLNDVGGMSIQQLTAIAKNWVRKHGVRVIYIDYLQLVNTEKLGSREQEVSDITRKLKALAKELKVPVIALSQLSRGPESRPGKRPILSDLRDSGSIEQDADIVIFPFRPGYYGIKDDENGRVESGRTILDIAKFRTGPTGEIWWMANLEQSSFEDFPD